jgi:uncharacterized phiE125 gp8 family phage protein
VAAVLGSLELVTAASAQAVTTADAKTHLKIEADAEDDYVAGLILDAQDYLEKEVSGHRQIMPATYDVRAEDFAAWPDVLPLPRPPLSSVTSVKYFDADGVETTVAASTYLVRTPWRQPGTIELAPDQSWPTDLQTDRRQPVTIRIVAGYASEAAVPRNVRRAILLLCGHWHLNRESQVTSGGVPQDLAFAVSALLEQEGWGSYR